MGLRIVPPSAGGSDPEVLAAIQSSRLLGSLPRPDLAALLSVARMRRRGRREVLSRGTDDMVLLLLTGTAKEHRTTADGLDVVVGVLGAGDMTGLTATLGRPSGGDVTTLEPAQALMIAGSDLRSLARSRPAIALSWLQTTTNELADLRDEALAFTATSTTERVLRRLQQLCERWGEPCDEGLRLRPRLTQEELASWAGSSRESTAKVLQSLRQAEIISTRRRSLTVLDPEALQSRSARGSDGPLRDLIAKVQ
jgi:CRP/FNR family transcriptional regulator, cyclic AMP receptor protein